jgi:hypothetical protein
MLAKSPADRYATPAEVIAALAPWLPNRDGAQKVAAGLSASQVGRSSTKLRNTLDQVLGNSTARLPAGRPARADRRAWLAGGLAAGVLAAAVAGALPSGGKPAVAAPVPAANPPAVAAAPARPAGVPKTSAGRPAAVARGGQPADFAALPDARQAVDGGNLYGTRVGEAELPAGWIAAHYMPRSASEFRVAEVSGARAVGVRLTRGPNGAQLKARELALGPVAVGEAVVIRLTYRCDGPGDGEAAVQADGMAPYTRFVRLPLPPTSGDWQEVELTYRREAAGPIALVVEPPPAAGDADATLWLRGVQVVRATDSSE